MPRGAAACRSRCDRRGRCIPERVGEDQRRAGGPGLAACFGPESRGATCPFADVDDRAGGVQHEVAQRGHAARARARGPLTAESTLSMSTAFFVDSSACSSAHSVEPTRPYSSASQLA